MSNVMIRRYKSEDIEQCIVNIDRFFNEDRNTGYVNQYKDVDFDKEKMYRELQLRVNDIEFFCNLIFDGSEVVGGLCAYVASPIFSSDRFAYDQLLYVTPDFKNPRAVIRLISTYVDWAERRKVKKAFLRNATGFKVDGFTKLCQRMGFEPFETALARSF